MSLTNGTVTPESDIPFEEFFLAAFEVYKKHKEKMMDFYGLKITFSSSMIQFWESDDHALSATIHLSHKTVVQRQGRTRTRKDLLGLLELL